MINIFSFSAMALYLGAWILLLRELSSQKKNASRPFEIMLTYLAVIAHGLTLAPPIILEETPNLALGTTLSLIVFLIVTLFLIVRCFQPIYSLGLLVLPIAFSAVAIGWWIPGPTYLSQLGGAAGLMHVTGAGLAYALLSLALAQALLLGFQDKRLKQKQSFSLDMALPPIQTMEVTLFQMVYSGFGLLTLTLISGVLSSNDMFGESFLFNHHTVLALLAWISLLGLVLGRICFGWRGRIAIVWTGLGFTLLALGYFGSRFVLEIIL